jgi:hypothetical protein
MRRIRRKTIVWVLIPIILLLSGGVLFAQRMSNNDIGNLQIFKGTAQIVRGGQTLNGQTGTPVDVADHIKAGNGSTVAIVLKDTSIVRLEGGSEVEVTAVTYQDGKLKDANFTLISGRMWSRVQKLPAGSNFDVETPTVTAAVRGTSFNTTFKNQTTGIYVYHHSVNVTLTKTGGQTIVPRTDLLQMHNDSLKTDFGKGPSQAPTNFYDAWIKFNMQQDDQLCQQRHDIPGDCGEPTGIPPPPTVIKATTPQVAAESTTAPVIAPTTTTPKKKSTVTPLPTPIPTPVTLQSISVSCILVSSNIFTHYVPPTYRCSALPHYSDGSTGSDITSLTSWTVQYPTYGSISSAGVYSFTTTCYGNTVIGIYQGKQATFAIPAAQSCIF